MKVRGQKSKNLKFPGDQRTEGPLRVVNKLEGYTGLQRRIWACILHSKCHLQGLPGGYGFCSVAKAPYSQCRGPGFNIWSGNSIPYARTKRSRMPRKDGRSYNWDSAQPNKYIKLYFQMWIVHSDLVRFWGSHIWLEDICTFSQYVQNFFSVKIKQLKTTYDIWVNIHEFI